MKRYLFYVIVALLTFAVGVRWTVVHGSKLDLDLASSLLVASAICFGMASAEGRGVNADRVYSLLMSFLGALMSFVSLWMFWGYVR
jgi:hypothetical protein